MTTDKNRKSKTKPHKSLINNELSTNDRLKMRICILDVYGKFIQNPHKLLYKFTRTSNNLITRSSNKQQHVTNNKDNMSFNGKQIDILMYQSKHNIAKPLPEFITDKNLVKLFEFKMFKDTENCMPISWKGSYVLILGQSSSSYTNGMIIDQSQPGFSELTIQEIDIWYILITNSSLLRLFPYQYLYLKQVILLA